MADEQDSCSRQASSLGSPVDQVLIKPTAWNSVSMVYIPESYYADLGGLNSLLVHSGLDLLTITMPCGITINIPLPHTVPPMSAATISVSLRMPWCH